MDRDGIPARVMVTGGHPRWEGRGVSSPIQDAIGLAIHTRMPNCAGSSAQVNGPQIGVRRLGYNTRTAQRIRVES